jgi:4-carboxymuconolactone decarboxylase
MTYPLVQRAVFALCALACAIGGPASAQQTRDSDKLAEAPPGSIRMFVSGGARAPVLAVRGQIEKATGRKLYVESSESRALQKEIEAGQAFEAAVLSGPVVKDLIAKGKIVSGTDAVIAEVRVGVSVRGTPPKLDVSTPEGIKAAILGARSIRRFYGAASSTPVLDNLFDKLGVGDATKDRMVVMGDTIPPETPLKRGEYELIINLATAIKQMDHWAYLGLIPEQFQMPVQHVVGLGAAGDQAAGRKVIDILKSADFEAALKANGAMRPKAAAIAAAQAGGGRLPILTPPQYSAAQKQAADEFRAVRNGPLSGPFEPMMYSPEVMTRARAMGDYLRYKSGIGNTLSELVIIVTAREWNQDYEWSSHAPIAAQAGIKPEIIAAIHDGRRPDAMSADEAVVYDFTIELLRNKRVSDETFARAERRFGKPAVVDLVGVIGYYTFNAMILNVAEFPAKDGVHLPR